MDKTYISLGLMSGTSMDGIDASIIESNGHDSYETLFDQYFQYDDNIYKELINIRDKINTSDDLSVNSTLLNNIEKKITLFHATICKQIIENQSFDINFIGFHGQTIFHNAVEKISCQLGDANLLSSLLKKNVIYNFRENDMINGGQGAPLAPIFHQLIVNQNKIKLPTYIVNIGGIANITIVSSKDIINLKSYDIGPGNCLLDEWVRKYTKERYDNNGEIAKRGKTNQIILNHAINNFDNIKNKNHLSYDVKNFNLNFVRGLSLEDGLSTLTDFTGSIIYQSIVNEINFNKGKKPNILICGGGRKNQSLINCIKEKLPDSISIALIDDYKVDGDFVESQAFAYLAIRSHLNLPISFPLTTGCKDRFGCTGGLFVKNY